MNTTIYEQLLNQAPPHERPQVKSLLVLCFVARRASLKATTNGIGHSIKSRARTSPERTRGAGARTSQDKCSSKCPRPAPASNPEGKEDQLRPNSTTREVGPKERPSKPEVEAEQAAKETELHPKSTGQPKLPLRDPTNETSSEVGDLGSSDLASGRKRLKPPKPSSEVDELESSIPKRPTKRPRFENKSPEPPRAHSPTLEPEPEVEKATRGKKVAGAAPKPSEPLIVDGQRVVRTTRLKIMSRPPERSALASLKRQAWTLLHFDLDTLELAYVLFMISPGPLRPCGLFVLLSQMYCIRCILCTVDPQECIVY
ncbi:hypothetical protein RSAG8_04389, partial [Rhizoctonia solani AG-8 WAC10335]